MVKKVPHYHLLRLLKDCQSMTPISILGIGCLERIADYIKPMIFRKALIGSDKVLVDSGLIGKLLSLLDSHGIFYIIYTLCVFIIF
ncbi:hypothetical protein [Sporomusa carbonis]|uniref:hypothetical protein n=1 Tax=Sporomusa carbonis TaxID=3076075 RepID=UPI003C7D3741